MVEIWSLPNDRDILTKQAKPILASHAPIVSNTITINEFENGDEYR